MNLYRRDYKIDSSLLPLLVPAPPLNQGPFPPPALPGYLGNTGLSAIPLALSFPRGPPVGPAFADPPHGTSRVATGLLPQTCRHQNPGELAQCSLRPLPAQWQPSVLKPGQRSHYMILGLAQCSFALLPVRSLTPFKGAFFTEGSGVSLPPRPPRLLPAGAKFAGWVFISPTGVLRLSHGARGLACTQPMKIW